MTVRIERAFPQLVVEGYTITSTDDPVYNCHAFAVFDTDNWWSPVDEDDAYWPEGVPRELTVEAFTQAFATEGFEPCKSASFEPGYIKIALYAKSNGEVQHTARQLTEGRWTSKLGDGEDIAHTLEGLCGYTWGQVVSYLKKRRTPSTSSTE